MSKAVRKRRYFIIGMHRSATSFLAKCLHDAGVDMGSKLLPANERNEQGYFENKDFNKLNASILEKAKGDWRNVPTEEAITFAGDSHRKWIKELLQTDSEMWGVKDPRMALTGHLYLPHLSDDDDNYLICIFRKPSKVAKSLKRWANLPIDKGWQLARQYNIRTVNLIKYFLAL